MPQKNPHFADKIKNQTWLEIICNSGGARDLLVGGW
jgi:hypothetical protein